MSETSQRPQIVLQNKRIPAIERRHPWVFSGAIKFKPDGLTDGTTVDLVTENGQFLATGHFQDSSISVRIISFKPTDVDQSFWADQLSNALNYRKQLPLFSALPTTNCYRLIHGEGDGLPGLIIDIYNKAAVIQCHSIGMYKALTQIGQALDLVFEGELETIYSKSQAALPSNFGRHVEDRWLKGDALETVVSENGHLFKVNWVEGQKTGFFLDQRVNRQLVGDLSLNKKVLNTFCYTGGFSIYALKGGAQQVDSVDISKTAINLVDAQVALNELPADQHQSIASDVLTFLKSCDNYDLMIVDPPAFAKTLKKRHNAVQGYKRLNAFALKKVKVGGTMATFSCSQVVDDALFYNTITAAAHESGRKIRVMKKLSQGPDHPVNMFHPEGSYLKGLLLYVE